MTNAGRNYKCVSDRPKGLTPGVFQKPKKSIEVRQVQLFSVMEIINKKAIQLPEKNLSLRETIEHMVNNSLLQLPIIDRGGRISAAVDIFLLINHLIKLVPDNKTIPNSCCRHRLNTININEPISNAAYFPVDRFVLDDNDRYEGMLSRSDVIRGFAKKLEIFHFVLDCLDIGIGILSDENNLIYANKSLRSATESKDGGQIYLPLEQIQAGLPAPEERIADIPVRYQYKKSNQDAILLYYPLEIIKEMTGTIVLVTRKPEGGHFSGLTSPHPTLRTQGDLNDIRDVFPDIVIVDPKMEHCVNLALKASGISSNVFISGPTGVGKEIVAEIIHRMGPRAGAPLVKVNCAAIPETLLESELFGYEKGAFTGAVKEGKSGLIEAANKGSLFLDEINSLPMQLQAKLLRFLQSKEFYKLGGTKTQRVDVRIIAAANSDIKDLVKKGSFREDLYYRLCVIPIPIPSLKDRPDEIVPLAMHFLTQFNSAYNLKKEFSAGVLEAFQQYSWPGNVRELQHLIEQLVVLTEPGVLEIRHLPEYLIPRAKPTEKIKVDVFDLMPLKEAQDIFERTIYIEARKRCKSVREIADKLGIHHSTVVRKLQYLKTLEG